MRAALDRLLARPSTLRILRRLITEEDRFSASVSRAHCRLPREKVSYGRLANVKRAYASSGDQHEHGKGSNAGTTILGHLSEAESNGKSTKGEVEISLEKWNDVLHFKQRVYGWEGVQAVWKELRQAGLDLPTTGPYAESFWEIFLSDFKILPDVVAYAEDLKQRTNFFYKPLYESVIGRFFSAPRLQSIPSWHDKLFPLFAPEPGAMRRLASKANGSKASMEAFNYIYVRNDERNVYDILVPLLCSKHQWRRALRCHSWLIKMNDLPTGTPLDSTLELSFREVLMAVGQTRGAPKDITAADQNGQSDIRFSRETMNRTLGEVHGIEPKKLDDHFCARIFATKAFSIDVIIRGLGMFGVEEVGPLALREMATRTVIPKDIAYNIQRLNEAGISIGYAVYSLALRKFADEGREDLIRSLIETDQHPETFEDRDLQRKLLGNFIEKSLWDEVHRTLAILTVFHHDPVREQWNILLQKVSSLRRIMMLCKVLDDMQSQSVSLTEASLSCLQVYQLRPRKQGNAPLAGTLDYDDTTLIANIWRTTLASGGAVGLRRWTEIFKRYGMTERFADVAKLALWLADWYSPSRLAADAGTLQDVLQRKQRDAQPILHRALEPTNPAHPLRQVFSNQQLRAFIAWGIRRAFVLPTPPDPAASTKGPHYWAQGLRLCCALRRRGVLVSSAAVAAELRAQLRRLFGHGRRSNRSYNRRSVANCPYSILEMVEYANELWEETAGKPLIEPSEMVRGPQDHFGQQWLKAVPLDVLLQVQAALEESGCLPDSGGGGGDETACGDGEGDTNWEGLRGG